ncbi:hypothetical protein PR001_g6534 [Phytophthora rubi]|uniref:Uncharacterized protein n=1 Tax=Phytophthora rubi TaxID=129364 RepID=A0A6A3N827_9STRA|nr:hypothetical protein PR001_g6534 [Phytophthora rubi]
MPMQRFERHFRGRNASSCKHCKQQVLYYKESEQAIRHLKKCAPFQELRHQFAFVYPFSDVLPLYNQKIYAKDTQQARQDGPGPAGPARLRLLLVKRWK